jgi:hypothetical protein
MTHLEGIIKRFISKAEEICIIFFAITFGPSSTPKPLHTHAFMLARIETYLLVQEVFLFKDKDIFSDSPPKIMAWYTLTNKALKQNNTN